MGHASVPGCGRPIRARPKRRESRVLEQEGITYNFDDTITCVIPTDPSWTNPQVGERRTQAGTFRFFAMPARLVMDGADAKVREDVRDQRFDYPRATPEKALLDWIYLGASTRSRMTRPPLDTDLTSLNMKRLLRVARHMEIEPEPTRWLEMHALFQADPEVQDNQSLRFKL